MSGVRLSLATLAAALALAAPAAQAAPTKFFTTLSGANEFIPNASPATGTAEVLFDLVLHTMTVTINFEGLLGVTTAAHIHCCALPSNPATTTPSFIGFPSGVTEGFFSQTYDMTLASSYRAGFLSANGGTTASAELALYNGMLAGLSYLNVHTRQFPGGEILGILRVPAPATLVLALAGLGLLAAGAAGRRGGR